MRNKQIVLDELKKAERIYQLLKEELSKIELEENFKSGHKIYQFPVTWQVNGYVYASGNDFEEASNNALDFSLPFGEYMDGSFVINPYEESEENLIYQRVY